MSTTTREFDRDGPTPLDERYADYVDGGDLVIYDRQHRAAWVQADTAVPVEEMR